jgi:hypothetical protein
MLKRRIPFSLAIAIALVAVAGAAAEPIIGYTATGAPSHVKPSTQTSYTITLANDAQSLEAADKAKIGIPPGFVVSTVTQASASAAGDCVASTWIEDGTLIADGKINLKRPGGGDNSRLCPGATLTVGFSATSAPADGTYVWATELLKGEDIFVLSGSQPTVQVDGTAPVVTLISQPTNPSNVTSPSFGFSASEPAAFTCKVDGDAFATCTSPTSYTLGNGAHMFTVRATDAAGNTDEESYGWTIDTVAPTVTITQKPNNPSNVTAPSFGFTATEPAQCKLDAGPFEACTSPKGYSNLDDGPHTFTLKATDAAGNTDEESYGWTIDTRAPAVAVTSGSLGLSNRTSASFSFSADEPATFQCNADDRGFEPCGSPAAYAGLRDGGHAFTVRATDAAGNVGAASHAWTVDATAPQTTLDFAPARSTKATSARFAFSSSEPATFQCRLDGGSFSSCSDPKTYKRLKSGLHRFAVRAIDPAGNVDATPAVYRWTVGRRITRTVATSALLAPASGARVTRPPLLRWRAVSRATYYNVQLYRAGRKVLTSWPARPSLQLRVRWKFNGRLDGLKPGTYRWYVWPGYGPAAQRRYGRLLGTSTFIVRPPS